MKKLITTTVLASTLVVNSVYAVEPASTEQNVGVASGALVGAAAGGPVGFILGAVFGGLLGNEVNESKEFEHQLTQANNQNHHLTEQVSQLKVELNDMTNQQTVEASDRLQMDLLFHTAMTDLSPSDQKKLTQLAEFLKRYPALAIKLDGFADPRGSEQNNQALSEQRINTVKQVLVNNGINPERIFATAHGEQKTNATEGDLDAYALERRVSVRFFADKETAVAAN